MAGDDVEGGSPEPPGPARRVLSWLVVVLVGVAAVLLVVAADRPAAELVARSGEQVRAEGHPDDPRVRDAFSSPQRPGSGDLLSMAAPSNPDGARAAIVVALGAGLLAVVVGRRHRGAGAVLVVVALAAVLQATTIGQSAELSYGAGGGCIGPFPETCTGSEGVGAAVLPTRTWRWGTPQLDLQLAAVGVLVVAALASMAAGLPDPDVDVPMGDRQLDRLLR